MSKASVPDRDHCDPCSDLNLRLPGKCDHPLVYRIPEKKCISDTKCNKLSGNQRKEDVQTIYTSSNADQIKSLIEKYKISYLFIGSCEYEKYGEINSELLASIGKVVFRQSETTIIEVSNGTMTE